jgi:hypothetical protein
VNSRLAILLIAGALLFGRARAAIAQDTAAAQDTAVAPAQVPQDTAPQGYAPAAPAPASESAPATPAPAPAGQPSPTTASPGAAAAASRAAALSRLGFVEILSPRSSDRILRAIEQAKVEQREADAEFKEQEALETQVKAMVEVKKQEVSTLDAQRKLAAKNKREAEVATFEAEKKDAERHKQFLERRVMLHEAEQDAARARMNLAESTQKALELELQLASRRIGRDATTDPGTTMRHESVIRELERKVLEAQRVQAEREKQVADKHQDIAKRRLELYQAQAAAAGTR